MALPPAKKTKVSERLPALEFMCKNSCLKRFIFSMLNDYTINLTNGINQTTPAPGVGWGRFMTRHEREQCVLFVLPPGIYTQEGVWGERACMGREQSTKL